MSKKNLLVSSCLLGYHVKYNGLHNQIENNFLKKLSQKYRLFPLCPEVEGGLPTPRIPCEIVAINPIKVVNQNQVDKTLEFTKGATITLDFCKKNNITLALLKSNSPSCSNRYIYDGTFSSKKIKGMGITAKLLQDNGIKVLNEDEIQTILT